MPGNLSIGRRPLKEGVTPRPENWVRCILPDGTRFNVGISIREGHFLRVVFQGLPQEIRVERGELPTRVPITLPEPAPRPDVEGSD
jgi:hypothetical protein